MPVYEYRCNKGHQYEKTEGFDAPTQQKCLNCGAAAKRIISMPAVIFKGSGFYSTDNRKSGSAGSSAIETPAAKTETSGNGHGHSHGPDGHSHDAPAKTEAAVD